MKCAECQATSIVGLFATISNTGAPRIIPGLALGALSHKSEQVV